MTVTRQGPLHRILLSVALAVYYMSCRVKWWLLLAGWAIFTVPLMCTACATDHVNLFCCLSFHNAFFGWFGLPCGWSVPPSLVVSIILVRSWWALSGYCKIKKLQFNV